LQQTIEMFEVIVQASPQDTQSLEILKDAYTRLGKAPEATTVSRRLGDVYRELGQYSQALLEYETILHHDANNMEVMGAIGEVEELLQKSGQAKPTAAPPGSPKGGGATNIKLDFGSPVSIETESTLITTSHTLRSGRAYPARGG